VKELFPELKGLKGGKKQHWINANLDKISMLAEIMSFEDLRKALYCKEETLTKALQKAEQHHRPTKTKLDKNALEIEKVGNSVGVIFKELQIQAEVLSETVEKVGFVNETLSEYHGIQARLHNLMEKQFSGTKSNSYVAYTPELDPSNFTEHIASTHKRKVGPTSLESQDRLRISSGRSRVQPLRPKIKGIRKHRSPLRRRWRDV